MYVVINLIMKQQANIGSAYNIAVKWNDVADDQKVMQAAQNAIDRAKEVSVKMGLDYKWIYQNYASAQQNVFEGYGKEKHERLWRIQKKYDPHGVFTKLQPGYFKV